MKTSSILKLAGSAIMVAAAIMLVWSGRSDLGGGGGAYAVSPDGHWLAEIDDANSRAHHKSFAVIQLWDLNSCHSITARRCTRFYWGKAPTVRLEFPQTFHARDENCNVKWETNSTEFFVEFESNASTRRFRYNLAADVFSLSIAPAHQ